MDKVNVLVETARDIVQESIDSGLGKKNYYLSGIYSQCEIKNNNGRIYPFPLMEREINKLQEKVGTNVAFGEFGHPKKIEEMPDINENKVSHRIVEIKADGKNFIGKSVLIPAGMGEVAIKIIETGGVLSVSSRALGKINERGMVENNLRLFTYDIVFNPGMPGANQNAILENKVFFVHDNQYFTEEEWKLVEKNRKDFFKLAMFKADLLSSIRNLMS